MIPLPIVRACELPEEHAEHRWLVRGLWGRRAQGVVGGAPKLGKSWFGLDLAVSVATGTPCLDHFPVDDPGPALIYMAEDDAPTVRARLDSLCRRRGVALARLNVHVITVPVLRLDNEEDRRRLAATLEQLAPRLLLLDPLVRLHRLNENKAQEISGLLGFLTELQRAHELAVIVVHHTGKKSRSRPGQSLRGSSDLHAWGASNAYITEHRGERMLTLEHRAAPAPEPVRIELVSKPDGTDAHLRVAGAPPIASPNLATRIVDMLRTTSGPLRRGSLRAQLRVSNNRLGEALVALESADRVQRTAQGWVLPPTVGQQGLFPV